MKKQKGLTLTGMVLASIVVVALAMLTFKVLPVLIEYRAIERQFKSISDDPTLRGAGRAQLDRAWAMRAAVESMTSITGDQIEYTKDSDGRVLITGEYSVKVPLFWNVSLFFDFKPSSK